MNVEDHIRATASDGGAGHPTNDDAKAIQRRSTRRWDIQQIGLGVVRCPVTAMNESNGCSKGWIEELQGMEFIDGRWRHPPVAR